ncbi:MAG: TIGR03905 family TSCPD domain-containing protein [Oscillospiraceae bacterium]|nr:TIGR03905 family TSCPD domain-containing protein [Oscillospiraceae bacterium]
MTYTYKTKGVCSRLIEIEMDEAGRIAEVSFQGGCHGNLQGIGALAKGRTPEEVISVLEGIRCGMKSTSCPDQLAMALKEMTAVNA